MFFLILIPQFSPQDGTTSQPPGLQRIRLIYPLGGVACLQWGCLIQRILFVDILNLRRRRIRDKMFEPAPLVKRFEVLGRNDHRRYALCSRPLQTPGHQFLPDPAALISRVDCQGAQLPVVAAVGRMRKVPRHEWPQARAEVVFGQRVWVGRGGRADGAVGNEEAAETVEE